MKLLFVNPCLRYEAPHRYLPVGLGYIVTAAKEAGFDFDLLDVDLHQYEDAIVEHFIRNNHYDVIALGAIVTHYKWIKWFTKMVKEHQPHCKIILGNSVGSSVPELALTHMPIDVVVIGEGDVTILEVLEAYKQGLTLGAINSAPNNVVQLGKKVSSRNGVGIEGIVFRDENGQLVNNGKRKAIRKIDDLPFPDWDLFDVERYIELCSPTAHDTVLFPKEEAVVFPINTARGCVHKCTFCHYVFWDDPYRHRSAQSVLGEIRRNQEKYGANYINFWDELSFHKLAPTERFMDALLEADLGIHWTAAIRSDLFGRAEIPYEDRKRVAEKMVRAGGLCVGYSLESADDDILLAMNKKVKSEYFAEQVRTLNDVGLLSQTSLVFGYPQETPESIRKTLDFCYDLDIYPSSGFLLPMPSTGMWEHAIEHGFITDQDEYLTHITERQDVVLNMTSMSDEEMLNEVKDGIDRINKKLDLKLNPDRLIKTGGYAKHTVSANKKFEKIIVNRSRNSNNSLNYANVTGSM